MASYKNGAPDVLIDLSRSSWKSGYGWIDHVGSFKVMYVASDVDSTSISQLGFPWVEEKKKGQQHDMTWK